MTQPLRLETSPTVGVIPGNYVHCAKCVEPFVKSGIPYEQHLEVLIAEDGGTFQVRCKVHDCNIVTVSSSILAD